MKNTIHYFLIISAAMFFPALHGCKSSPAKTLKPSTPKAIVRLLPTVTIHDFVYQDVFPMHNPRTFGICKVYANTDSSSKVLEVLKSYTLFKTATYTDIEIQDTIRGTNGEPDQIAPRMEFWIKVTTTNGDEGYVSPYKIARFTYDDPSLNARYLIYDYPVKKGNDSDWKTRFVKLDLSTNKVISQVECYATPSEYTQEASVIKNLPLKNVRSALIFFRHGDYCGGGGSAFIMVDTPTGLKLIPASDYSNYDGGGIYRARVYLPTVDNKGVLKLYADAETKDRYIYTATTLSYPADIKIPIGELIVRVSEDGEYLLDKDGYPVVKKKHQSIIAHLTKTIVYYRWDGYQLKKIAENKIKIK